MNIPNYIIGSPVGKGGMATVYLATHEYLARQVAMKVISADLAMDELHQKQLVQEGKTVAGLDHPHIVKIYDVGRVDGRFYMAMEFLSGGSLQDKIAKGAISVSESAFILKQVAEALDYAHARQLIHRDIKPSNIMFREDGLAVLTDFGIAKQQDTKGELTQMGFIVGSPSYMSPEQVMGEPLDHRTDIYSLGVVFYEMITGLRPYTGENTAAISYQHMNTPIPQLPGHLSEVQAVLDKVLAKRPDDRYASASEFIEALMNLIDDTEKTKVFASGQRSNNRQQVPGVDAQAAYGITDKASESSIGKWLMPGGIGVLAFAAAMLGWLIFFADQDEKDVAEKSLSNHQHSEVFKFMVKADLLWENGYFFDYRLWSADCKKKLQQTTSYTAENSAEIYYKKVLALEPANQQAAYQLSQVQKKAEAFQLDCEIIDNRENQESIAVNDTDEAEEAITANADHDTSASDAQASTSESNSVEADNLKGKWYFVTSDTYLNMRKQPHKRGKIIGRIQQAKKLKVVSNTLYKEVIRGKTGYWVLVKYGNKQGYVYDRFIEALENQQAKIFSRIEGQNYVVTASPDLNVRAKPNARASVIGAINKGSVVRVISQAAYPQKNGYWVKVKVNNRQGYVYDRYLIPLVKYKDRVQRLTFEKIEGTEIKGQLKAKKINTYVLRALAGQKMDVSLKPEDASKAVLNIYTSDNRVLSYGKTSASVPLTKTQDYYIAVVGKGGRVYRYDMEVKIPALK